MPAPSLCHFSGSLQIPEGSKATSASAAAVTHEEQRNAGGHQGAGLGQYGRACFISFVLYKNLLYFMWKMNTSRVWICVTMCMKKDKHQLILSRIFVYFYLVEQSAYKSSFCVCVCVCLAHTGDTVNVLSGFLCGVSVLAQGSDLRGHGVLVMPPRLTVPVCPQSVCKQIKRRGLFN